MADTELGPSAGEDFSPLRKTSVGLRAAEHIKRLIIDGKLQAGARLPSEGDLAAMLGISRPSLREAIKALTAMNILVSRHGEGTFVSSLEPRLLSEPINFMLQTDHASVGSLFEVRRLLEVNAAELAAGRITADQIAALDDLVRAAEQVIDVPEEFLKLDFEIHDRIVRAVDNPILSSLCDSISQLAIATRRETAKELSTRKGAHRDHVRIVEALRSGDAEAARASMLMHLNAIEQVMVAEEREEAEAAGQ